MYTYSYRHAYFCIAACMHAYTDSGAHYSAERNGTERLIPKNTYFAERIKIGPKQFPSLVVILKMYSRQMHLSFHDITYGLSVGILTTSIIAGHFLGNPNITIACFLISHIQSYMHSSKIN